MTDNKDETYRDVLPQGFVLHWYEMKSVLGRGAFGVTYLAQDKNLDQFVAIKEYFPNEFSTRESSYTVHPTTHKNKEMYDWGLNRFIREARILAKFKHPNIVRVLSVFENNNTAYMVMEYEQGKELSRLFKEKAHFTEQEMLSIFLPVMEGLKLVHDAGFIHRDIKPSNIYIREDKSPVLIDFGSARQVSGVPTRALTSLVTYGYAPFEQYNESEDKQGPWTDVYSLGASLYFGLTGKLPIEALARGSNMLSTGIDPYEPLSVMLKGKYPTSFLRTIDHALLFHANERPQDVMVWADMLDGKQDVPEIPVARLTKAPQGENLDATVIRARKSRTSPDTLGEEQAASSQEESSPDSTKRSLSARLVFALLIIVVIFGAGATLLLMSETGEIEPTTPVPIAVSKTDELLAQADQAYQAGNYIRPENNNALQLYLRLLTLEPAHEQANSGVAEIIKRFSDSIRSDLTDNYFDKAEKNLQLLFIAKPDSKELIKLQDELKNAQTAYSQQLQLLAQADKYLNQKKLVSPIGNNALSTLRQVLKLDPGNKGAMQRIEIISSHYIKQVKKEISEGKFSAAHKSIRNLKLVDDGHPEIASLDSRLVSARNDNKQQQLGRLLRSAKKAVEENRLISPSKENAFYLYQSILSQDSENIKAKNGVETVKAKLKIKLEGYLETKNYVQAESLVTLIETSLPRSKFTRGIRADWNNNKPASIQMIEAMISDFRQAFESGNQHTLAQISDYSSERKGFIDQLFSNYRSFSLKILNVRIIGKKNAGHADIKITKLVNMQGLPVQPGAWSQFEINIKKNEVGQWKIYW